MKKITDLNLSSINNEFAVSDLLGNFNIASFCGKSLQGKNENGDTCSFIEPLKLTQTNSNTSLSNEVIEKLIAARKYVIADIQTISYKEPSLDNLQDENIYKEESTNNDVTLDYYSAFQSDNGFVEYYEKFDKSLSNGGIFFMASEIDGNIHLFSLNVLKSGQTGKSVTLTYLPNGKINNAILLERYCYHGDLGNTHVNPDGTIINKEDIHLHKTSEEFIDEIINNPKLTTQEKSIKLNFPPAKLIESNVNPNKANISMLLNKSKTTMSLSDVLLENIESNENLSIVDSIKNSISIAQTYESSLECSEM